MTSNTFSQFLSSSLALLVLSTSACSPQGRATTQAVEVQQAEQSQPEVQPLGSKEIGEMERELRESILADAAAEQATEPQPGGAQFLGVDPVHFAKAAEHCTGDLNRLVRYRVRLDESGTPLAIRVTEGSGSRQCDDALVFALEKSRWQPCLVAGVPAACEVDTSISLPGAAHR